ncbi:hypothetical protein GCM10009681_34100 [Luedemannella helvata]|uniref:Antifreeze protein n=1 Tax=Luedemannella helvata TaxID=349315 RepID=A0ABN2KMH4_9ACTN
MMRGPVPLAGRVVRALVAEVSGLRVGRVDTVPRVAAGFADVAPAGGRVALVGAEAAEVAPAGTAGAAVVAAGPQPALAVRTVATAAAATAARKVISTRQL